MRVTSTRSSPCYEPEARLVTPAGETLVGREQIRRVLAKLIDAQTRLRSRVVRRVTAGDVAVLYTDFEGTTLDASGREIEVRQRAVEVLRRQAGGSWLLLVGDPTGRQREADAGGEQPARRSKPNSHRTTNRKASVLASRLSLPVTRPMY